MITLIDEHDIPSQVKLPHSRGMGNPDWPVMEIIIRPAPDLHRDSIRSTVRPISSFPDDPEDDLANATWEDAEWQ